MKKVARNLQAELGDNPELLEARLVELDRKLDRLRSLYESYFMGVERAAPSTPRRELNRLMLETQQVMISNAALRFRMQSLLQRWVLYTTYWNRTIREIEAGTYRRDVAKVQRHLAARGGSLSVDDAIALGIPARRAQAFVERQGKARSAAALRGAPATAVAGAPVAGEPTAAEEWARSPDTEKEAKTLPPPGLDDDAMEAFYRRYLAAREKARDSRPAVPFEDLKSRLRASAPKVLEDGRARGIELEVFVEGDRVRVRAKPVR